jgi:hypothetical protein
MIAIKYTGSLNEESIRQILDVLGSDETAEAKAPYLKKLADAIESGTISEKSIAYVKARLKNEPNTVQRAGLTIEDYIQETFANLYSCLQ